ncbi:uncharacterized protein V3H82_013884 [Fundulus diaphanus]
MSQYDYSHKDRSHSAFMQQPYHGLYNQGSTCYLNSVLQVLFMTKDFRDAVERYDCDAKCLDFHLKELFDALKCSMVTPYKLTDALGISRDFVQSDAAECFENILSRVTNPAASQLFQGMLTTKNRCSTCNKETSAENPFWSLPLEMEDCYQDYLVTDGIDNYFKESHLSGLNQLYCEHCSNKSDTTIKVEIKHHPEVLTLLLKRFKFDYVFMKHVKVIRYVKIPEILEIPPYGDTSPIYQLYAYVEHSGELRSGHYVVTIRAQDDDTWYCFNDHRVSLLQGYQQPFKRNKDETSSRAYLLFYRKVSATEPCNADDARASTAGSSKSDQSSRNGEEPREGEESKEATARPECSGAREKTHQNKGEMDHSMIAGTHDSFLSPTDQPSELRKSLEKNNDGNSMKQGNKQEVRDSRESTQSFDDLHNKQHQDIDRKQDVSGKLSENHATHLSDEDVGVSKPETREKYKHPKIQEHEKDAARTEGRVGKEKELFNIRENQTGNNKMDKQEANQEKIKPDFRNNAQLLTRYDLVEKPVGFENNTSKVRPETEQLKMTDPNSTDISTRTQRNRSDDPTQTNRKENKGEHPTCHNAKAERGQHRTVMTISLNKPPEANKDSQKRGIRLSTNYAEINGKFYDFCEEIAVDKNEKYLVLKEICSASEEDFSKLSKCSDPQCKINQLLLHVHTCSSEDPNRKEGERKIKAAKMQTGGTSEIYRYDREESQETRPLNQPERGLTAPLRAANQNPVTRSTTNRALEKGEADGQYSHLSSHTSQTRTCSSLQGSGGSGAALQQSLGTEGQGSIDTLASSLRSLKLNDSSDPNKAGGQTVSAETCHGSPPFPEPDDGKKKANDQCDTRIQVETKEPEEGNSSAVCSGVFFRTFYN